MMQNEELRVRVMEQIDVGRELDDEEIRELIGREAQILNRSRLLSMREWAECEREVFHAIRGLDLLQELVDDEKVTEIMVNGRDGIFYEKDGNLYSYEKNFKEPERIMDIVWQIVGEGNRQISEARPILDTRLKNGARVNIVLPPVALNGPIITIRRFPDKPIDMDRLVEFGALSTEVAEFLKELVQARYNIFVSGGTGAGKTTFLNALSGFIPETERIVTIEDSAELQIQHVKNLVRLESRNANADGENGISIRDLIKTSLRMRPDRIIVGEVRGAEAIDLLQAQNSGHDGCMSTGHANSAKDMLSRLETMVLTGMDIPVGAIRGQIAAAIDICIHLERFQDGSRKVTGIYEMQTCTEGVLELRTLYEYQMLAAESNGKSDATVMGVWKKINELQFRKKQEKYGC